MLFEIIYRYTTASGNWTVSNLIADGKEEAERICKAIENLEGYRLVDVTRVDHLMEVET